MTTPTKEVAAPTALELEAAAAEEIDRARRAQVDARREMAQASDDFAQAERDRDDAIGGQVKGERGADNRLSAAIEAIQATATRRSEAERRQQIAAKVEHDAETRREQVRVSLLDELAEDAEEWVAEVEEVRAELEPLLRRYMETFSAARRRWHELEVGTTARVEQRDRERGGYDRRQSAIDAEAQCPPCPLTPALFSQILGITPKPAVLHENYEPGAALSRYLKASAPAPELEATQEFLSPDDPRWQRKSGPSPAEIGEAIEQTRRRQEAHAAAHS